MLKISLAFALCLVASQHRSWAQDPDKEASEATDSDSEEKAGEAPTPEEGSAAPEQVKERGTDEPAEVPEETAPARGGASPNTAPALKQAADKADDLQPAEDGGAKKTEDENKADDSYSATAECSDGKALPNGVDFLEYGEKKKIDPKTRKKVADPKTGEADMAPNHYVKVRDKNVYRYNKGDYAVLLGNNNRFIVCKKGGNGEYTKVSEEYAVIPYRDGKKLGGEGFFQAHHIIQDEWAKVWFAGDYSSSSAWTILLINRGSQDEEDEPLVGSPHLGISERQRQTNAANPMETRIYKEERAAAFGDMQKLAKSDPGYPKEPGDNPDQLFKDKIDPFFCAIKKKNGSKEQVKKSFAGFDCPGDKPAETDDQLLLKTKRLKDECADLGSEKYSAKGKAICKAKAEEIGRLNAQRQVLGAKYVSFSNCPEGWSDECHQAFLSAGGRD